MEVLGAVASSIAVVQALAAGKQAVSLFREIPDIQKDFDYLMRELDLIKSMAQAVSRMAPTAVEQDLIGTAARNLNDITAELEALLRICSRESGPEGNKMNKTGKRKWLVEKSDIKKLQQRMNQAKETLHFALNSSRAFNDIRFQAEMRQMMINMYTIQISSPVSPQLPEIIESPAPVQQLQDDHTPASDAVVIGNGHDSNLGHMNDSVQINSIVSAPGIPSDSACRCRCHFSESQYRSSSWMHSLLGSWLVNCKSSSRKDCSYPGCHCMEYTALRMEYQVPKWFLIRTFKIFLDLCRDIPEATTNKVHEAILQSTDLQEALQEQHWAINTIDGAGDTPLILATAKNQVRSMEVLISAGADVNQQSYDGWTPLMAAVNLENVEAVKLLLKSKSDVNLCDEEGVTAFYWASQTANPEVISLLLASGASIKQRDFIGDTPLHWLTRSKNTSHQDIEAAIEMLLVAGSDIEARSNTGHTPFLRSIAFDKLEVTRALVNAGCYVHVQNGSSQNVLHLAACYASLGLLYYISDIDLSGLDLSQQDSYGGTPFDYIVRTSHATSEWELGGTRRPSLTEQEAFADIYQDVRDQALQNEIQNLERVLGALQEQDIAVAREHPVLLVEKEKRWDRKNLVSWYRGIDKRIQHAE
ncbi:ankyrin repeat PH SEC7 domain-containing protein [Fusarium pseudocircinatum]|uniref:Ankyrin repeat PH SEC7 domain-containing protein n=1 Tax=Fusarium pseudocircinatum TaxID=56676 RepID=A0A8H5NZ70_9HYPO|nr:ankyrin repeat PH SEC7 domain-containing protein [Fusarium pseudocircinatum]